MNKLDEEHNSFTRSADKNSCLSLSLSALHTLVIELLQSSESQFRLPLFRAIERLSDVVQISVYFDNAFSRASPNRFQERERERERERRSSEANSDR